MTLECNMPSKFDSLSATHQIYFYDFEHGHEIPSFMPTPPKENFFNHLVTVLRSTVPSSFTQKFSVASVAI